MAHSKALRLLTKITTASMGMTTMTTTTTATTTTATMTTTTTATTKMATTKMATTKMATTTTAMQRRRRSSRILLIVPLTQISRFSTWKLASTFWSSKKITKTRSTSQFFRCLVGMPTITTMVMEMGHLSGQAYSKSPTPRTHGLCRRLEENTQTLR